METSVFRCDFCGQKSDEEHVTWRQPRCSIELVLRGRRFVSTGSSTLYGVPFAPPPSSIDDDLPKAEDERWASSLCDRCMKRIAALFGLTLETHEEVRAKEAEAVVRASHLVTERDAEHLGLRAEMVQQFPTPARGGINGIADPPADGNGGLVSQWPTEGSPGSVGSDHNDYSKVPVFVPDPVAAPATKSRKSQRRKPKAKKTKRAGASS